MRGRSISRRLAVAALALSAGAGVAITGGGTAAASVPNAWAFALVTAASGPVNASHWAESRAAPTPTASPAGPGVVVVRFRNIGLIRGGVVHVTAVTDQLAWCQAVGWKASGGNEYVTVRCFGTGGVPKFVPFTVMYSESSGTLPGQLAYAYVRFPAAGASSYNSSGMANTVTAIGTGRWLVRLRGAGPATPSGGIQVTAVSAMPRICDVAGWTRTTTQQAITVACYGPGGKPAASAWTLSYQRIRSITGTRPRHFAYTWNNKPLVAGPYAPLPPAVNVNSAGGVNSVQRAGTGQSMVVFRRMAALPNIVFVTAAAPVPRICNLNTVWATSLGTGQVIVRDVNCYRPTGPMTATQSFVSYDAKK